MLGFEAEQRFEYKERGLTIQFLSIGEVQLELFGYSKEVTAQERKPLQAGIVHMALEVDNLDETYLDLQKRGIKFQGEPRTAMMGQRILFLSDPDGNTIELVEWRR
jgi:catechol 2,3-dioxygenase-like lactoylglutathione lyase family enzyme